MGFTGIPAEDRVIYVGKAYDIPEFSAENATVTEKMTYIHQVNLEERADLTSLEMATNDLLMRGIEAYLSPQGISIEKIRHITGIYHDTDNIYQDLLNRLMGIQMATSGCVYRDILTEGLDYFPNGIFLSREEGEQPFIIVKGDTLTLVMYFEQGTPELNSTMGWIVIELYVNGAPYQEMSCWELIKEDGRYSVYEGGIDGWLSDENTVEFFLDKDYNLFGEKP